MASARDRCPPFPSLLDHRPRDRGVPGRIRTCDLPLRRRLLCPLSYGDPSKSIPIGAGLYSPPPSRNADQSWRTPEPMPELAPPRISVINDNPEFLELMSAILDEDAGYAVTLLTGETAAIDDIAASAPD